MPPAAPDTPDAQADSMYLITDGAARVTRHVGTKGVEVEVATLDQGRYFGELALLTQKPRAASVWAKGKLVCARISSNSFNRSASGPAAFLPIAAAHALVAKVCAAVMDFSLCAAPCCFLVFWGEGAWTIKGILRPPRTVWERTFVCCFFCCSPGTTHHVLR